MKTNRKIPLPMLALASFATMTFAAMTPGAANEIKDYGFFVRGVTGKNVMLDRTWERDCAPDGFGSWEKSVRTMSGHELATTVVKYHNASPTPNCETGASMIIVFVQTLHNDNVQVPVTWVDAGGKPAAAPKGLEGITTGNGATGRVTYAAMTPLSAETAEGLNQYKFGGQRDWRSGDTKNRMGYFGQIGEAKGVVIVDDRTSTGAVYDGISENPKEYPKIVPNIFPHSGPLNGIKF